MLTRWKPILRNLLLAFVFFSLGWLAARETAAVKNGADQAGFAPPNRVMVYYFHSTMRCEACDMIERYTAESLRTRFPSQMASGVVQYRVINKELRENEHFVDEFSLTMNSVVLELVIGGRRKEWKNLGLIWDIAREGAEAFADYIAEEISPYLEKLN